MVKWCLVGVVTLTYVYPNLTRRCAIVYTPRRFL
eukprot:SAG11_NODE_49873_length_116_cov_53.470588_1_plen_33_part_01